MKKRRIYQSVMFHNQNKQQNIGNLFRKPIGGKELVLVTLIFYLTVSEAGKLSFLALWKELKFSFILSMVSRLE